VIAGFSDAVNWTRDAYPSGACGCATCSPFLHELKEQYHNKEKIKALQETIVKQENDIAKLHHMEETLNLQRQEIMTLNEIVNEMKLKWDRNRQDTMLVNEKQFNHKNSILENQQQYQAKNTSY
jgi:uncharacterized coiled-coil protein SlyX